MSDDKQRKPPRVAPRIVVAILAAIAYCMIAFVLAAIGAGHGDGLVYALLLGFPGALPGTCLGLPGLLVGGGLQWALIGYFLAGRIPIHEECAPGSDEPHE